MKGELYQFSNIWEGASTRSHATLIKNLDEAIKKNRMKRIKPTSMESQIPSFAQQTMKNMAHLMEEGSRHCHVASEQVNQG